MASDRRTEGTVQASRVLDLLPVLRQWAFTAIQRAGEADDVSFRQYAALRAIQDGVRSPGELARLWQVTPAVLTGIVDRLETRGLIRREPDPLDRRRQILVLTAKGALAEAQVERALTVDLAARLSHESPEELAALGRALDLLHRAFTAPPQTGVTSGGCEASTRHVDAPSGVSSLHNGAAGSASVSR